jgi:hypothetical protein
MNYGKIDQIPLDIKNSSIIENNRKTFSNIIDQLMLISFWKNFYTWIYISLNLLFIIIYTFFTIYYYPLLSNKIPLLLLNNNFTLYPKIVFFIPLIFLISCFLVLFYISYKTYYKLKRMYFLVNTLGLVVNFLIILDIYKILQIVI